MDASLTVQFWIVAISLAFTPGPDWAYAITAGVHARSVIPAVSGMVFGYVAVVVIVAVGLGALMTQYPVALAALTIAGSLYLLYLGMTTLTRKPASVSVTNTSLDDGVRGQFFRGAGVSGINPKGILLLVALLPQFTTTTGWPASIQMLFLGGLHILNCAIVYTGVAVLARRILRSRPRASCVVTKIAGAAMTVIGLSILVENVLALR